ncbi:DUF6428 family protein [Planktotalea sp.]|uniref:DUF6428 family protein n=1 Tax=Planktotalea sp. TaxID=2029877 RepID=UPI00329933F5
MTSFAELLADISRHDSELPLVFQTEQGDIGAGYHVTELRHSQSKGIDCGGKIESWEETRLQLLDGAGTSHMNVGKFRVIVEKSLSAMPELGQAPLLVEFGHDNSGLTLLSLNESELLNGRVVLRLGDARAVCKPFERAKITPPTDARCCA